MSRAGTVLRAVAIVAAAALAMPAAAYRRSSAEGSGKALFWPMPVVPFHVSDAPARHAPSCAAGGGADPALEAAVSAFAAWRQGCADLDLVYAGRITEVRTGLFGTRENVVVFRNGWCSTQPDALACMAGGGADCGNLYDCFEDRTPGDRFIVALTSVLYDPDTGRIVNADIEVNGWDGGGTGTPLSGGSSGPPHGWYFTCDTQDGWRDCTSYGEEGCNYVDLQNTLTHEAGHFLGLAHPCGDSGAPPCSSSASFAETTMYPQTTPGDLKKRTLSADDAGAVCAIYPSSGGCGCGAAGAPGAVALLLAALALRRRPSTPPRLRSG